MQLNCLSLITSLVLLGKGVNPILGGNDVNKEEFPWLVRLLTEGKNRSFGCAGTLIELDLVLTAAHCVINQRKIIVTAGQRSKYKKESTTQTRVSVDFISYPYYNGAMLTNDIGLIKLESKFEETNAVKSITFTDSNFDETSSNTGIVAGWGRIDNKRTKNSGIVKKVEVPIVKFADCKEAYLKSERRKRTLTPHQFCTGKEGKGSCYGDSGGPFICIKSRRWFFTEYYEYIFCGIVSYGEGCGRPLYPGVYTKVSSYLHWIQQTKEKFAERSAASGIQHFVWKHSFTSIIILFYHFSTEK